MPPEAIDALEGWDWVRASRLRLGRIYALRIEDEPNAVGLLAIALGGKTRSGRSCVEIVFLAKSPKAFAVPIAGIGTCFARAAIILSFDFQSEGRVRIRKALRQKCEGYSPAELYRSLGLEGPQKGVEYDDLEIRTETAEALVRKYDDER